jgi:xanthine dehydrogenase YagS FAD-binding subunit
MLPNFAYVRARSVSEATEHASADARIHAGGTDLLGCLWDRVFETDKVVSISGLTELEGIRETPDGGLRLGALTKIAEIAGSRAIKARFPGLAQAAESVASPQLRNQGTLGGNLCQRPRCWYFRGEFDCIRKGGELCYAEDGENRYHAIFGGTPCYIVHPSDTAPMLVALGASVRAVRQGGERVVPLDEFYVLPEDDPEREHVLEPGEILTHVMIPGSSSGMKTSYRKVRERGSWDFALASVALALRLSAGQVEDARIVLGGVAPVPWRSRAAEDAVIGKPLTEGVIRDAAAAAVERADPMAQNGYKVPLVRGIIEESLGAMV